MTTYIWRHYKGSEILHEGQIQAPCRVTAKRVVTKAIKEAEIVKPNKKSSWIEKSHHTINSIDKISGVRHLLSSNKEFIVFFRPKDEEEMIKKMTSPQDLERLTQITLF